MADKTADTTAPTHPITPTAHPLPAVALLIHDDLGNLVASVSAISGDIRPHWNLPEDFIQSGEDYLEAAVRIAHQYTGISAEASGVYAVLSRRSPSGIETLSVVLLVRVEQSQLQATLLTRPKLRLITAGSDIPFFDSVADTALVRRFWSGEWSVISKSQGYFSEGAGI